LLGYLYNLLLWFVFSLLTTFCVSHPSAGKGKTKENAQWCLTSDLPVKYKEQLMAWATEHCPEKLQHRPSEQVWPLPPTNTPASHCSGTLTHAGPLTSITPSGPLTTTPSPSTTPSCMTSLNSKPKRQLPTFTISATHIPHFWNGMMACWPMTLQTSLLAPSHLPSSLLRNDVSVAVDRGYLPANQ
jgi:hypothetical protein